MPNLTRSSVKLHSSVQNGVLDMQPYNYDVSTRYKCTIMLVFRFLKILLTVFFPSRSIHQLGYLVQHDIISMK